MKSVLDDATREELKKRIGALDENSRAQWGKMTVGQMMRHCTRWDEMALGKTKYRQSLIGKLFGRVALKDMMKDEPVKKNLPTVPSFKIKEAVDAAEEKKKWLGLVDEYAQLSDTGFMHPFFGHMTKEQTAFMVYKHADHHLRQFNG